MTERKPREISFASWIDQQIAEAADRGAFDNLPGAGKPIPRRGGIDAWLQDYLRREGASADELLPAPLRLRKEAERLAETVGDLNSEDEVREVVRDLNRRIVEWRRIPTGPPVYLRLVDEAAMVARWRDARHRPSAPPPAARPHPTRPGPAVAAPPLVAPPGITAPRPAVRTVAAPVRRTRAGWRSARRPAAPRRHGRGWAGRCRRRPRG